ncbi:dTMP kinase [Streptomyces smyrnaeus]|uniref:dTMP kinase n=1 Tax=Streptomyces smyrnaeus TaxID=1387713 RepID=UPI001616A5E4
MQILWPILARPLGALQRVLLVALLTPAVLIALAAAVPALALLPFLPGGTDRAIKLLTAHTTYLRTLLTTSRPGPGGTRAHAHRKSHEARRRP